MKTTNKRVTFSLVTLGALLFLSPANRVTAAGGSLGDVSELGITFFPQEAVSIIDRTGGRAQSLSLIGTKRGNLIFWDKLGGELLVPMDKANLKIYYQLPREFQKAKDAFDLGNYAEVESYIGPLARRLVPYTVIPPESFNIHPLVLLYYQSLVKAGNYKEGFRLAVQIPFKQLVNTPFLTYTREFLDILIMNGENKYTIRLLSVMYKALPEEVFIPIAQKAAGELIRRSAYGDAQTIYRTLANAKDEDIKNLGILWLSYCDFQNDENVSARILLEAVPEIDQKNDNFPIYCLLHGRLHLIDKQSTAALEKLSLSMVLTPTDKFWKAELYYWNAIANWLEGHKPATAALQREMKLYFPDDP